MKLRYTSRAIADINSIADYINGRNPAAAVRVGAAIERTIDRLRDNPGLGVDRPDLGVRKVGVPRYTYSVFYRVGGDTVEIAHVRDDRREPPKRGDV